MTTATASDLRLVRLVIDNVLRIPALTIDADGNHVSITGPNGSGKTSAVNAIWLALKGYSSKDTPDPIHHGAEAGEIELDLGEFIVTRRFTAKSTTLKITARDGSDIKSPQKLLDSLLGTYSLDPVAFLQLRPQDQVDAILAVAGVRPPVEKVREITGENFTPRPDQSADGYLQMLSADETGIYYTRRREQNRVCVSKQKAVDEAAQALEAIGGRPTELERPESTEGLLAQLKDLEGKRTSRTQTIQRRDELSRQATQAREEVRQAGNRINEAEAAIKSIDTQVAALKAQIEKLEAQKPAHIQAVKEWEADQVKCLEVANNLQAQADALTKTLAESPDPAIEAQDIQDRMSKAQERTKALTKRGQQASFLDQMVRDKQEADEQHTRLDDILAALRYLRLHLLDNVDLGIAGLSVGDGEVKLNDVSLKQASHAEKLRLACAVAMRQNPRLKLLRVDDGEHLDADSRALLFHLANQYGWQVVITSVSDSDRLAVEIEEANTAA
jgi:hypothetical protein